MIFENAGSRFGKQWQGHKSRNGTQAPPPTTLKTASLQVERKSIELALQENARGRFLRITETVNGHRNAIVIPSTGLDDFKAVLEKFISEQPPQGQP